MKDVTRILSQIEQGDPTAADQLLPMVYDELRKLAAVKMAQESPDHTLQATALVHEAYVRLLDADQVRHWDSRGHFFAAASKAMRRILVESARRKRGPQRGGDWQRADADLDRIARPAKSPDVLELDAVLEELTEKDPKAAKLVELRYFGGLTLKEAAAALGISSRTADSYWAYAKAWLHEALSESSSD